MKTHEHKGGSHYQPDYRLSGAYERANLLDEKGIEELCPSYLELSEVSDRYQVGRLIGRGGIKEVYKTYDNRTRRWIALARLREDRGPAFYDHFVHEGWIVSSLDHPNIIKVHDLGVDSKGHPFFTMDLKGNISLADRLGDRDMVDITDLLKIFLKICEAVAYAHTQGIIHLDLKPENIQIETNNEVLVCDWGLGKSTNSQQKQATDSDSQSLHNQHTEFDNMTLLGEIKGTLGYMAPEQVTPDNCKDQRTDVFALGCILHAIVTGEPPFRGKNKDVIQQTTNCLITPLSHSYPNLNLPRSLEAVVMKALKKEPRSRYTSVTELQDEIQRYLNGYSTRAENAGYLSETRLFILRNRPQMFIGICALILMSGLCIFFVKRVNKQQQLTRKEGVRAQEFEMEAQHTRIRYLETLSESREKQSAFAAELTHSANTLKNMGIFVTPHSTITEASRLATNALTLNPQQNRAKYELFSLNLITLNFKQALEYKYIQFYERESYKTLAQKFPNLNFDQTTRPSIKKFTQVIAAARSIDANLNPLLERMISYDSKSRYQQKSYHLILSEFIKNLNQPEVTFNLFTNLNDSSLRLQTDHKIKLICTPGGSGKCVLRYLPTRNLVIESTQEFDLTQLEKHPVQILDLRNCSTPICPRRLHLPNLSKIIIRSGQIDPEFLKQHISSRVKFIISED